MEGTSDFSAEDSLRKMSSKLKVNKEKSQEYSGQLLQYGNHHSLPTRGVPG